MIVFRSAQMVEMSMMQRALLFALSYIFLGNQTVRNMFFCQLWSSESVDLCLSVALSYHVSVHLLVKSCFICTCFSFPFVFWNLHLYIVGLLVMLEIGREKEIQKNFFSPNWWNDEIHKDYATAYLIKDHLFFFLISFATRKEEHAILYNSFVSARSQKVLGGFFIVLTKKKTHSFEFVGCLCP